MNELTLYVVFTFLVGLAVGGFAGYCLNTRAPKEKIVKVFSSKEMDFKDYREAYAALFAEIANWETHFIMKFVNEENITKFTETEEQQLFRKYQVYIDYTRGSAMMNALLNERSRLKEVTKLKIVKE